MTITVGDVIKRLMPAASGTGTVDLLIAGQPETTVTAIATAFTASYTVIQQAIDSGVNLLITHEGTYYSHQHDPNRHAYDSILQAKQELIARSGIAIYRCHDYWHRFQPDGIMIGLLRSLGWESSVLRHDPSASIVAFRDNETVGDITKYLKNRLGLSYLRVVGDLSQSCKQVGLLVGYRGSADNAIPLFHNDELDLLLIGEGPEWEIPEYVKDAVAQGRSKALIVLGHAESEIPGMRYLADWLGAAFPGLPVRFMPEGPLFQWV